MGSTPPTPPATPTPHPTPTKQDKIRNIHSIELLYLTNIVAEVYGCNCLLPLF